MTGNTFSPIQALAITEYFEGAGANIGGTVYPFYFDGTNWNFGYGYNLNANANWPTVLASLGVPQAVISSVQAAIANTAPGSNQVTADQAANSSNSLMGSQIATFEDGAAQNYYTQSDIPGLAVYLNSNLGLQLSALPVGVQSALEDLAYN